MSLEGAELSAPLRLELIEEGLYGDQRLRFQAEQPDPCILGNAVVFDYPGGEEDLQVPAHGRLRHPGRVGQLAGSVRAGAEQLNHPPSGRVSQGFEHIH